MSPMSDSSILKSSCSKCINNKRKCKDCYKEYFENLSIGEILAKYKNVRCIFRPIRKHARYKAISLTPCQKCGYDKHVEVCHIQPIHSFPKTATVKEVNHVDNLICLCRNCHWELDRGSLSIQDIKHND